MIIHSIMGAFTKCHRKGRKRATASLTEQVGDISTVKTHELDLAGGGGLLAGAVSAWVDETLPSSS